MPLNLSFRNIPSPHEGRRSTDLSCWPRWLYKRLFLQCLLALTFSHHFHLGSSGLSIQLSSRRSSPFHGILYIAFLGKSPFLQGSPSLRQTSFRALPHELLLPMLSRHRRKI